MMFKILHMTENAKSGKKCSIIHNTTGGERYSSIS